MLNYENVVETGSETDEDERLVASEENRLANGGGGGGGAGGAVGGAEGAGAGGGGAGGGGGGGGGGVVGEEEEEEEEEEMAGGSSPVAGVPAMEASPRVGHALLSYRGQESPEGAEGRRDGRQGHHPWAMGEDMHGHLNGTGELGLGWLVWRP